MFILERKQWNNLESGLLFKLFFRDGAVFGDVDAAMSNLVIFFMRVTTK